MVDRRALPGLAAGFAGFASGVAALVVEAPVWGGVAAVFGLVAAGTSVAQAGRLRPAERDTAGGAGLAPLVDVPCLPQAGTQGPVDDETELPDASFFILALDNRVSAARRRLWPVTVLLVEIGLAPECEAGQARREALGGFADLMRRTLREADISCRTGHTRFAVVLDDTGEEGAVWTAERLQVALSHDVSKVRRMAAGVASYPTHGLEGHEVLARAEAALDRACARPAGRGLGQVEVALPDFA